jgi:hypothetical protein
LVALVALSCTLALAMLQAQYYYGQGQALLVRVPCHLLLDLACKAQAAI